MILNKETVKAILQISSTSYDTLIDSYLLKAADDYLINEVGIDIFTKLEGMGIASSEFTFTADTKTIAEPNYKFSTDYHLLPGQKIYIYGTKLNDGVYTIATVADYSITVVENIVNETVNNYTVDCVEVIFSKNIDLIISKIVGYEINKTNRTGAQSEKIGDYSVNYSQYPYGEQVYHDIQRLKKIRFIKC